MRIQIQEAFLYVDPCGSGSETLVQSLLSPVPLSCLPCPVSRLRSPVLSPVRSPVFCFLSLVPPVLWIRIRMDPELLPGSGIIVPDPDPAKYERADK